MWTYEKMAVANKWPPPKHIGFSSPEYVDITSRGKVFLDKSKLKMLRSGDYPELSSGPLML